MTISACGLASATTNGPNERETEGEGGVHGQGEQAVGREQLPPRHQERDHRGFGRTEERRHGRDEDHQQVQQSRLLSTKTIARNANPRSTFVTTQHVALVDAIDEDAGDGREDDRRDEEAQEQRAHGPAEWYAW